MGTGPGLSSTDTPPPYLPGPPILLLLQTIPFPLTYCPCNSDYPPAPWVDTGCPSQSQNL